MRPAELLFDWFSLTLHLLIKVLPQRFLVTNSVSAVQTEPLLPIRAALQQLSLEQQQQQQAPAHVTLASSGRSSRSSSSRRRNLGAKQQEASRSAAGDDFPGVSQTSVV